MQDDEGSQDGPRRRPASATTIRLLKDVEARFAEIVDDLDLLGLSLAAARTEHALDTFRKEAERLTAR